MLAMVVSACRLCWRTVSPDERCPFSANNLFSSIVMSSELFSFVSKDFYEYKFESDWLQGQFRFFWKDE